MRKVVLLSGLVFGLLLSANTLVVGADNGDEVFSEDFESGAKNWEPTDASAWKLEEVDGNHIYTQFKKKSDYTPPHRSPYNIALNKQGVKGSFVLTAKVRSTHKDYGHRDCCLFFNYVSPAEFYYVHLGKKTDDHANQIFIVNNAPRTKISEKTTEGTDWDDKWHNVKIVRNVEDGLIAIYFDDMKTPVMVAHDKTFTSGRVGVGSFDDTSAWDDVQLKKLK